MERIGPHFAGELARRDVSSVVRIIDEAGAPLANTRINVEQVKHAFGFGNIGFDFVSVANEEETLSSDSPFGGARPDLAQQAEKDFFDLFNFVTLPFYWAGFEPEQGKPDTLRLKRAAQWIGDRGAEVKGHPLAWHTLAPKWLLDMNVKQIEEAIRTRITRDVTEFAGLIDMWDAINEVVIMPIFDNVEALTYWGFSDDGSWLGAPVGLVRRDGSAKPSLETLRGLIKGQWWVPPTQAVTDDQGRIELHGCAGRYRVEVGARGAGDTEGAAEGTAASRQPAALRTIEFDATSAAGEVTISVS